MSLEAGLGGLTVRASALRGCQREAEMWWWPVLAEVDPRSVPSLWDWCRTRSEAVDEDGARRPPSGSGSPQ